MFKKAVQITVVALAAVASILVAEHVIGKLYRRWSRRRYTEMTYGDQGYPWEK